MNGWIRIGVNMDKSKFDAQYKELEIKIKEAQSTADQLKEAIIDNREALQRVTNEIDKVNKGLLDEETILERIKGLTEATGINFDVDYEEKLNQGMSSQQAYAEILKIFQAGLTEELKDQNSEYEKIVNKVDLYKSKIKELGEKHVEFAKKGTQSFKSLIKGAKNLVLGIIGVTTLYGLVSKAVNSYMSADEKATQQIATNWVGLGVILEPAIKFIIDLFKKAVTGVLYFISVLTKTDYIAKANALALKKQAKATKELTKANQNFAASFDELNIAQENNSNANNEVSSIDPSMLFNLNDLSKSTIETIEKLAKAFKPIWEKIKDIIEWGKENPDVVMKILGGAALLALLTKIIGVSGVSGLLGVHSLLLGLAALGIISIGIDLYYIGKTYKEVKNEIDNLKNGRKEHLNEVKKETKDIKENAKAYERNSDEIYKYNETLNKGINYERNMSNAAITTQSSLKGVEKEVAKLTGEWDFYNNQIIISTEAEFEYLLTQKELYDQGKLNSEQTKEYEERLRNFTSRIMGTSKESQTLKDAFLSTGEGAKKYDTMVGKLNVSLQEYYGKGNAATQTTKQQIDATNNLASATSKLPEKKTIKITSSANEVKSAVDNIKSSLDKIAGKEYKVKVTYTTNVGESISNEWDKAKSILIAMGLKPMATGGIHIVNNPGKGVISGGTIRGEVSSEGVIPLTNQSAMELLGESIGKHVKIYATLINKMNSRVLSKEFKEIDAQNNFASNI